MTEGAMKPRDLLAALERLGLEKPVDAAPALGISVRQVQRLLAGDSTIKPTIVLLVEKLSAPGGLLRVELRPQMPLPPPNRRGRARP